MRRMTGVVEALAFGCELALLVTLGVAGTGAGTSRPLHVGLAILLPVLTAGVWSVWMAPRSGRRLSDPTRFVAQCALFLAAGVLIALGGRAVWGVVFVVVAVGVFALTRLTGGVTGTESPWRAAVNRVRQPASLYSIPYRGEVP